MFVCIDNFLKFYDLLNLLIMKFQDNRLNILATRDSLFEHKKHS